MFPELITLTKSIKCNSKANHLFLILGNSSKAHKFAILVMPVTKRHVLYVDMLSSI